MAPHYTFAQPDEARPRPMSQRVFLPTVPQFALALLLALATEAPAQEAAQTADIPSPEEFFGHQMGADRKLAHWDRLVEYYELIGEQSDRVQVVHMGPSTLGAPFLSLYISAPENPGPARRLQAHERGPPGPPRAHPGRDRRRDLRGQGRVRAVVRAALHRSRGEPVGRGDRPSLRHARRRRDQPDPRQHGLDPHPRLQPRRRGHRQRVVRPLGRHRVRGREPARALPSLHRPRQQPRRVHAEHGGVVLRGRDHVPGVGPAGVHRPPPDGSLHGPHLPAAVRRTDPPRRRSPGVARDVVVRRAHRVQDGGGGARRRGQRRDLFRVGALRLPLDHPLPQHRGDAHRVGQRPAGDAAVCASGPAGRLPPASRVRSPDDLPEPVAGRMVARARHRGAADRGEPSRRSRSRPRIAGPCCAMPTTSPAGRFSAAWRATSRPTSSRPSSTTR